MLLFEKSLTQTDVKHRLMIPSEIFRQYFQATAVGNSVDIKVRYGNELQERTFGCKIRRGPHEKPVISKGWLSIVNEKKFKEGDQLKFHLEEDGDQGFYRFEVLRKITILGEQVWALVP